MRPLKVLAGSAAIAALVSLPVSPASADWYGHHGHCFFLALPFCIAGAALGTAAVIATAPFVVAGGVLAPGPWPGYYGPPPFYYYHPHPVAYYYHPLPAHYPAHSYYGLPHRHHGHWCHGISHHYYGISHHYYGIHHRCYCQARG